MKKVKIDELPISERFLQRKRLIQKRGELALIEDGEPFRHLAYFSLKKGKGYSRGGHYHLKKTECFYVIAGKLHLHLLDVDSGERMEIQLHEGQRVRIQPGIAHLFTAEVDAQVLEYYNGQYNQDDNWAFQGF
jgi:dTDP-4-dehydrorhamnose 3,5-epimerase-like enzyme